MHKNHKIKVIFIMNEIKQNQIILFFLFLLIVLPANDNIHAQSNPILLMEIPSSPNIVGSGAKSLGMGGAFIAIADDATAASWNPGALAQLTKPEISIVQSYAHRKYNYSFSNHPEASSADSINELKLNYFSFAYPFINEDYRYMIISLNYQHLYNFERNWNFQFNFTDPSFIGPVCYDFEQTGDLYALGLSFSTKKNENFFAGVTLNYWGDFIYQNKWEQKYHETGSKIYPRPPDPGGTRSYYTLNVNKQYFFKGWNLNLGFLLRINEKWKIGGVIKTPFKADIEQTVVIEYIQEYPTAPSSSTHNKGISKIDSKLRMPLAYGFGLAYRYSSNFTISGDFYVTQWNDFEFENRYGDRTSAISGVKTNDSTVDPTTWFRLGFEYILMGKDNKSILFPLRAGIFYDPAPSEGSPDDYYGLAFGTCITFNKQYIFDIAYQFRYGNNVDESIVPGGYFSQDVREHKVFTSLIKYF